MEPVATDATTATATPVHRTPKCVTTIRPEFVHKPAQATSTTTPTVPTVVTKEVAMDVFPTQQFARLKQNFEYASPQAPDTNGPTRPVAVENTVPAELVTVVCVWPEPNAVQVAHHRSVSRLAMAGSPRPVQATPTVTQAQVLVNLANAHRAPNAVTATTSRHVAPTAVVSQQPRPAAAINTVRPVSVSLVCVPQEPASAMATTLWFVTQAAKLGLSSKPALSFNTVMQTQRPAATVSVPQEPNAATVRPSKFANPVAMAGKTT